MPEGRRPALGYETVSSGSIKSSRMKALNEVRLMRPDTNYGLGVAKVINIDYEGLFVTLRTVLGASETFERVPVPLTFPGAGARNFFGSVPEIGDYCVVGWMPQESAAPDGGTKTPVILRWLVPGTWPGRDWHVTAEFESDEYDQGSPIARVGHEGAYDRIRHKLRHMQPGNILASSSQGSDLVLDEGILLSNRRGNEFRLRDQDQAAVTRALQRFDALAGVRVYAGMVQRDANILFPTMVSDGLLWDEGVQAVDGIPVLASEETLPVDPNNPKGFLTPAKILQKKRLSAAEGYLGRDFLGLDSRLDPFTFLRQGGYIDETGYVAPSTNSDPDVAYGGKPIYRVALQSLDNAAGQPDTPTLTEYRLDITHTSDGRLPVTEQTDMFDAERLPEEDPSNPKSQLPSNMPFIEWVLGSVIGNDAFSEQGKASYGMPLKAVIFEGDTPQPYLQAANITSQLSGVSPTPLKEQAATLFKLTPPTEEGGPPTFWSVNKQGQMRVALAGPVNENSLEAYLYGGLKLGIGGKFQMIMDGHIELATKSKSSIGLKAYDGSVHIYGGGPVKDQSAEIERTSGRGEETIPSLILEARTNALLKAEKTVFLKGETIDANASNVTLTAHDTIQLNGVKRVSTTTENSQKIVSGKESESWNGPKMGLPTNGALHERTYSPSIPGVVAEKIVYTQGDREEEFKNGRHTTTIQIGAMSYEVKVGTWSTKAATSSLELSSSGIKGVAKAGSITLEAQAGAASMVGMTGVTIEAKAGQATVKGATGVLLSAPIVGPDSGPIICAGSLDPLSGLPFSTFGMGAKNHTVGG